MFTTSKHKSSKENQSFDLHRRSIESKSAYTTQQHTTNNSPFDFNQIPLQAKLKINTPGDRYEQEADQLDMVSSKATFEANQTKMSIK